MGAEQRTRFSLDKSKCIQCRRCVNTCSGMVIELGRDGYLNMKPFERYGWRGCWRCQHCLAVCPMGAISIFNKNPEDTLPSPPPEMGGYMKRLIVNRRSCRRFLDQNVDPDIISGMPAAMSDAPHLFIAHERWVGKWAEDSKVNCIVATAYFELLCIAHGLGTAIMSCPAEVLNELAPAAREMLNIPRDHHTGLIVGFGYPEIKYARGVQKNRGLKVRRCTQERK